MNTTKRGGLSIAWKFFLFTVCIILILIAGTLLFSSRKATALANETVREGLTETLSVFDSYQRDRYSKLKLTNSLIAQDPHVQAYIAQADSESILDQAKQREADLKSDFIIIADTDGVILARTDKPSAKGQNIAQAPLVSMALEGEEAAGLWSENQNLYNATALPVGTGDIITAVLVVGYSINDALAAQIKSLTHSETAFFGSSGAGPTNLIATTFSENRDQLMAAATANRNAKEPFEFQLGPEKYIGVLKDLKNPDGKTMGSFLAFRSLDRELYGFHQFQKNIITVGLGIMAIALILSFLGAQRITGPLRQLTNAIDEVKEGNYEVPIEINSHDEVGTLADSFKKLLAELKEKAQLVDFLSKQPTVASYTAGSAATIGYSTQTTPGGMSGTTAPAIGPGSVIGGRYVAQSVLGSGGMGVVLKALDQKLDEVVALKMLKDDVFSADPAALERFKQELKLARRITHRNVVRTYDYSEIDQYHCISMEYVKGITLKQLIKQRGMLPVKIGVQIGKQLSSALEAAHEKGVVHRDIKPQNILLESSGDVKIMDFGIARLADMKGFTSTGTVMGTPDYMSPEQAQGLPLDNRTDVYSTGVVLFEVFTGKLPFIADSALAVLNQHIQNPPPTPSSLNPQIPPDLDRILLICMAKDPAQRYQKISDLHSELEALSPKLEFAA